ncbi:substance-P receptor-like [Montipora foliosa]|uniref:substance-P receptor-like n=1 Tax=Montipora foliosa TaxID=591990 RepID=UPI0035F1AD9C
MFNATIAAATNSDSASCPEPNSNEYIKGVKAAAYIVVIFLSFFGNAVVVRVVQKNQRMRTITNYLIINMALADLLTTVFNMLPTLYWIFCGRDVWAVGGWVGDTLCKLLNFAQSVSITVSVFSLCAIAFDRFFAISRPLKRVITFRVAKGIIGASWCSAMAISGPQLYVLTTTGKRGFAQCVENWAPLFDQAIAARAYTITIFVLLYALPLVTIAFLYTAIMFKLWRRQTPGQELTSNQDNKDKTNRKVLKMLVTVVIVFALSWLPLYVRMFVMFTESDPFTCGLPYDMDFLTIFLGHANSAVNPYIYVIFNENYRRGFKTVLSVRNRGSKSLSENTGRRRRSSRLQEKDVMIACTRLREGEPDLQGSEEDKTEKTLPLSTTTENLQT